MASRNRELCRAIAWFNSSRPRDQKPDERTFYDAALSNLPLEAPKELALLVAENLEWRRIEYMHWTERTEMVVAGAAILEACVRFDFGTPEVVAVGVAENLLKQFCRGNDSRETDEMVNWILAWYVYMRGRRNQPRSSAA